MLTRSIGDDASQKDLLFAMLISTGDNSGNIKADWQKVEKTMHSLGYNFTIGAMCKSSRLDTHVHVLDLVRFDWVTLAYHPSPEAIQHLAAMFPC